MTQNLIGSENPHDNIHTIWELPNLDGFFFHVMVFLVI